MKMYYKFTSLVLVLLTLTMFSCKDDEGNGNSDLSFVGNWRATSFVAANCANSEDNANLNLGADGACFEIALGTEVCVVINFTMNADGSLISDFITTTTILGQSTSETETATGTWEVLNDTEATFCLDGDCSTGTYSLSANSWTFSGSDADTGCDNDFAAERI